MALQYTVAHLREVPALPGEPLHLAIGMFDGVHLGHRAVIAEAVRGARADHGLAGVLTFSPHPSVLFRPQSPTPLILSVDTKNRLLEQLGLDLVITQKFDREFAHLEAEAFLPHLTRCLPTIKAIYVGDNWQFGHGRRGNLGLLLNQAQGTGPTVIGAARVLYKGEPISSTRIRASLQAGKIGEANAMLGYSYFSDGIVTPGKKLGRTLGFPTLNIPWEPPLRPKYGVYMVHVSKPGALEKFPAIANYGLRPTMENSIQPRVEAHLLSACPFGEGDLLRVEWLHFLRPEHKFENLEALKAQIAQDRAQAVAHFGRSEG